MNKILYIAAVLDPRQKMKHLETCFKSIYGVEHGADMVKEVTSSINALFEFYRAQHETQNPTIPSNMSTTDTLPPRYGRSNRRGSLSLMALQDDEEPNNANELAIYLTENK